MAKKPTGLWGCLAPATSNPYVYGWRGHDCRQRELCGDLRGGQPTGLVNLAQRADKFAVNTAGWRQIEIRAHETAQRRRGQLVVESLNICLSFPLVKQNRGCLPRRGRVPQGICVRASPRWDSRAHWVASSPC